MCIQSNMSKQSNPLQMQVTEFVDKCHTIRISGAHQHYMGKMYITHGLDKVFFYRFLYTYFKSDSQKQNNVVVTNSFTKNSLTVLAAQIRDHVSV